MKKCFGPLLTVAVVGLATNVAQAAVCVSVNAEKDNLGADAAAAKTLLEQSLEELGEEIGQSTCARTYTVFHVRLGKSINVVLSDGTDSRRQRVQSIEELPAMYDQMIRSLRSGVEMDSASPTLTRQNVTARQADPRRVRADSLWYIRLGPGSVLGGNSTLGTNLGFGYRYELDSFGIDASANVLVMGNDDDDDDSGGVSGSWAKLMGLYFFQPTSNFSPYVGAGVSWGGSAVTTKAGRTFADSGLQGELSVGYELLRASTIRMYLQLDGTLPFYRSEETNLFGDNSSDKSRYTPTVGLSFGIGWGKHRDTTTIKVLTD